jgi:hypothetical protein
MKSEENTSLKTKGPVLPEPSKTELDKVLGV